MRMNKLDSFYFKVKAEHFFYETVNCFIKLGFVFFKAFKNNFMSYKESLLHIFFTFSKIKRSLFKYKIQEVFEAITLSRS